MSIDVAVVGATGLVGEKIIELLEQSKLKINNLYPLASSASIGKAVVFKNRRYFIEELSKFDFSKVKITFLAAGSDIAKQYAENIVSKGSFVIDNSSAFRNYDDIPLVVPEVNGRVLSDTKHPCIIANPNCSTIQMCVALKPIHDLSEIKSINVSTYQSVSGAGRKGISELVKMTTALLNGKFEEAGVFAKQISFNCIPHIDDFCDNGYTKEEMKMFNETRKIFSNKNLSINATAVRVPTIFGHSESLNVETKNPIGLEELIRVYKKSKGIKYYDYPNYPTALSDAVGKNEVFIGRLRKDMAKENAVNLWVVADNVHKGAAWNAIQIAELLS